MYRPLDYCWFMPFLSVWLVQVDFEIRLCQNHTDSSACVLLGWHNLGVFAVGLSERAQYYTGN